MIQGHFLKLVYATDTKVRRFLKIKSEAVAYDSKWEKYFAERDNKRMKRDINGRKKLSYLYDLQGGICPKCGKRLTVEEEYRIRHNTGNEEILVHKDCSLKL